MPSNLLILPLLAGFLLARLCFYTRFRAQALEGYRLLLESALLGSICLVFSRLCVAAVKRTAVGEQIAAFWSIFSPFPFSGTAIGSVAIATAAALGINLVLWESWRKAFRRRCLLSRAMRRLSSPFRWSWLKRTSRCYLAIWNPSCWDKWARLVRIRKGIALNWATARQKNQLLILFNGAARKRTMVSLTLANRKVYVGYVRSAPSLDPSESHLELLPVRSGFRDTNNLRFQFTTEYNLPQAQDAYPSYPFLLVLPISDVQIASPFDPELYSEYFETPPPSPGLHFE